MTEYASNNVALYLNATNRTIQKDSVTKTIDDSFWAEKIVPILYPVWDSDRDKLETFIYYKDGSAAMYKNKHQRNQKTGEYKWVSYEMNLTVFPKSEVDELHRLLAEKYTDYRDVKDYDLDQALKTVYARDNFVNWNKLLIIRNFLLQDSDWTQSADSPLSTDEKELWKTYRQKLRDMPQDQSGVPATEVLYPITPSKYAELENPSEYLSDEVNHYYRLNQVTYQKYASRVLAYLSLSLTLKNIDEMPVSMVAPPYGHPSSPTLDDVLQTIEEGGI